jgi:YesN/AraC family two-component response regulator
MLSKDSLKMKMSSDFTISHNISNDWTMPTYHIHDSFEILFSLTDTTKFFVEDMVYDMHKGDLFIMNNMELHRTVAPQNVYYERYIIMFDPSFISSYSTEYTDLLKPFTNRSINFSNKQHLSEDQCHEIISLFKKLIYYHQNEIYGSDVYKKITFAELLLFICSLYNSESTHKSKRSNFGDFKKIEPILKYINQHLEEDLSLDKLSSVFFLNKYYISHLFKDNTGFSVNEYIINKRIFKSRELLKLNLLVSDVSEMVGFKNYCHFIRTFKNLVGVSPKQYAKRGS